MNSRIVKSSARPLVQLEAACRDHLMGDETVHALAGVSLSVMGGERVAILGPSGSGKSSLLNLVGLLDRPTEGRCRIDGQDVAALDSQARARLRNEKIGFVFQHFHLLPNLTALDNVALPLHYARMPRREIDERAAAALVAVGLSARQVHRPEQLSGGERQRVAIARAIVRTPSLLLADEPTGSLDSENGQHILELIEELNRVQRITVLMITHDAGIAARFPRCIHMRDGRILADLFNE
ncbi:MAG: ABC transporter ATP-binding protein [Ramlibacter sp.]|nr:ABC transporter ATP-binding protein [Ramlibacter sp.]